MHERQRAEGDASDEQARHADDEQRDDQAGATAGRVQRPRQQREQDALRAIARPVE
jgi:hypothetical protein